MKVRVRFREDQQLKLMLVDVKKFSFVWYGRVLRLDRKDGTVAMYPAWAVAGVEEQK